jgi:hypothetical protein
VYTCSVTKNRKGLTAEGSRTLTIRITADQRRRLQEVAKREGRSLGDIVRMLMMVGEVALTDPKGFAESFRAVARDQVLEDLGLPNDRPVERIQTEILADGVRRLGRSIAGQQDGE